MGRWQGYSLLTANRHYIDDPAGPIAAAAARLGVTAQQARARVVGSMRVLCARARHARDAATQPARRRSFARAVGGLDELEHPPLLRALGSFAREWPAGAG